MVHSSEGLEYFAQLNSINLSAYETKMLQP